MIMIRYAADGIYCHYWLYIHGDITLRWLPRRRHTIRHVSTLTAAAEGYITIRVTAVSAALLLRYWLPVIGH